MPTNAVYCSVHVGGSSPPLRVGYNRDANHAEFSLDLSGEI